MRFILFIHLILYHMSIYKLLNLSINFMRLQLIHHDKSSKSRRLFLHKLYFNLFLGEMMKKEKIIASWEDGKSTSCEHLRFKGRISGDLRAFTSRITICLICFFSTLLNTTSKKLIFQQEFSSSLKFFITEGFTCQILTLKGVSQYGTI